MRLSLTKLILFSCALPLLYYGCFDLPSDAVAPSWDVNLTAPVMNKTYTLKDIIEKDPTFIKSYPVGSANENLLYYADKRSVEPVTIGDKVKLDNPVQSVASDKIGNIKIQDPPAINTDVDFSFDPSIVPGSTMKFPQQLGSDIGITLPQQNEFSYIVVSGGSLSITLKSNLPAPVDISLSNISIENKDNTAQVGSFNQPVSIKAGETKTITIDLFPNVKIYNQLRFTCNISTPGSQNPVLIPSKALNVSAMLSNLAVSEVNGKLKTNSITTSGTVQIDNQSKFQVVQINKGSLTISLKNDIDVSFQATVSVSNLYNDAMGTSPFVKTFKVDRNSTFQQTYALDNCLLSSATPTSKLDYQVQVTTDATSDNRVIKSTQGYTGTVSLSQLSIKSFKGIVKPTTLDVKPTSVSLNLKDLKDKFKFDHIKFKGANVNLILKPSSDFKVRFDGTITAKGSSAKLNFSDVIYKNGANIDSTITIPSDALDNFLSSFSPNIPDELYISGSATVNPDFEQTPYSFASTDSITGYAEVNFPLNVGIDNGQFTDTTDISKDIADNKKDIEKIQSVLVTMTVTNGLAAKVHFEGSIYDATKKNMLLTLPPNRQTGNTFIEIPAAQVDANGKVTAPAVKQEVIELKGNDVTNFLNGSFVMSKVTLNTSGSTSGNPNPVVFKITDAIKVQISGKVVYKVDLSDK